MSKIKKIAVFTSIRSEYGLLTPLIRAIKNNSDFNLRLIVGGAHLCEEYGMTVNEIEKDGFRIHKKIPFLFTDDKPDVITRSLGKLQTEIGNYFTKDKPDLLVVLGDRMELIPVVSSALIYNIPIAHISGGDVTEGAIDNQVRNAISKMAHLHFPATEVYRQNLLRMGEENWRICVSGEPGIDEILSIDFLAKKKLFEELKLQLSKPVIICTFHPQTIDNGITSQFIKSLLLKIVSKGKYQLVITASNFDSGGMQINQMLEEISTQNKNIIFIKSLGQKRYYSLLRFAILMLGNSSSGIVEAQSFNLPVINVGNRQKGRLQNPNTFNTPLDEQKILSAIEFVQSNAFRKKYFDKPNIYGDGNACSKIIDFIKENAEKNLLAKQSTY